MSFVVYLNLSTVPMWRSLDMLFLQFLVLHELVHIWSVLVVSGRILIGSSVPTLSGKS